MRIVAVANQKGGCGKTTVIINLAACLARDGLRVLVIDLDPQGHCALGLAVPEEQIEHSIADVLLATHEGKKGDLARVTWQISSNFDLIPSRLDLSKLEQRLAGVEGRQHYLGRAIEPIREKYDFIVIDTPPTVGFLTESALNAATDVVVPVDTGYFSLQGLSKQLDAIRDLRAGAGRTITLRILANLYDVRTKLGREILAELRKRHGDAMFSSFINFNTKLKESTSLGQPITEYDPASMGCRDFVRFAREIISTMDSKPLVPAGLLEQADALADNANKLLATSKTLLGNDRLTPPEKRPETVSASTPEETARKIAAIYGAHLVKGGVEFLIEARGAHSVRLAGDFNAWRPEQTPMSPLRDGIYQVILPLSPGRYRYRYVIDGTWRNDPANGNVETNPYGELNSVVEVG